MLAETLPNPGWGKKSLNPYATARSWYKYCWNPASAL